MKGFSYQHWQRKLKKSGELVGTRKGRMPTQSGASALSMQELPSDGMESDLAGSRMDLEQLDEDEGDSQAISGLVLNSEEELALGEHAGDTESESTPHEQSADESYDDEMGLPEMLHRSGEESEGVGEEGDSTMEE